MVVYGRFEITQTVISVDKIVISITLPILVSYFFSYFKMKIVALYGFFEISQTVISIAKIIEVYDFLNIIWTCTTMVVANRILFLHGLISLFSDRKKSYWQQNPIIFVNLFLC